MSCLLLAAACLLLLAVGIAIGRNVERVSSALAVAPGAEVVRITKAAAQVKLERLQGRRPRIPREDLRPPRRAR